MDETDILFQEAFGARLFLQGKPRAVLEVKSVDTPLAFQEARLRGYDRAQAAESARRKRTEKTAKGASAKPKARER